MVNKAQAHLVQSEKMVALGNLVAGLTHEINTPLGLSVTSASELQQRIKEMQYFYHSGQLKRSDLERFVNNALQAADIILNNLQRAAEYMQGFKHLSADQTSGLKRRFNLKAQIQDVLLSLHPKLKRTSHHVAVCCPEYLEIESYPGAFSQIITNLLINTLLHGFEGREHGEIVIEAVCVPEDQLLQLRYSDNGRGMAAEERSRMFEPFFTTKLGKGGSGLGLFIIYTLVTQELQGQIECQSEFGRGTTFVLKLPLTLHDQAK